MVDSNKIQQQSLAQRDRFKRVSQRDILPQSVHERHVRNIKWDQAQGGSLVLGGEDNISGIFSLLNSSGVEKISMDNTGITISDGVLVIENDGGTTIIDSSGLVSTATFPNDTVVNSTGYNTTSESWQDVTGSSLDAFSLSRTTNVLVIVQAQMWADGYVSDGTRAELKCVDSVDGDLIEIDYATDWYLTGISQNAVPNYEVTGWSVANVFKFQAVMNIFGLAAGSHVLKLQFRREVGGSGTVYIGTYILSYIILGT